jgi:hypothetical protein
MNKSRKRLPLLIGIMSVLMAGSLFISQAHGQRFDSSSISSATAGIFSPQMFLGVEWPLSTYFYPISNANGTLVEIDYNTNSPTDGVGGAPYCHMAVSPAAYVYGYGSYSTGFCGDASTEPGVISPVGPWTGKAFYYITQTTTFTITPGDGNDVLGSSESVTVPVYPPLSITGVNVTCSPSLITLSDTSVCSAVVEATGGTPPQDVIWSSNSGSIDAFGNFVPSVVGPVTITAASPDDPIDTGSADIAVTGGAPSGGSVNVTSTNVVNGDPVSASWQFPLNGLHSDCAENALYGSQPLNAIYTLKVVKSCDSGLAFGGMKAGSLAQNAPLPLQDRLLSLARNMLGQVANAVTVAPFPSLTLTASTPSIGFTILWDPVADMDLSPNPLILIATAGTSASDVVTVANSGSAGSTLTWTATPDPSNPFRLTVLPPSDTTGLTNGTSTKAQEKVTVTADATKLSPGTYTGTIMFNGTSTVDGRSYSQTLTVKLTVNASPKGSGGSGSGGGAVGGSCGAPGAPCGSCAFSATPTRIVIPEQARLSNSCTNVSTCRITGGNLASPVFVSGNATTPVSPVTNSTYTLTCNGAFGGITTNTATVNVGNSTLCESNPGGTSCP